MYEVLARGYLRMFKVSEFYQANSVKSVICKGQVCI